MDRDPVELVEALQLADAVSTQALTDRRLSYQSIHLGTRALPIEVVQRELGRPETPRAPRTGHLGNWEDITLGRAGALDFNRAICGRGLGFPLIYCFTQTESDDPPRGDRVYMPGSLVHGGRHRPLVLRTWDGSAFVRRARDTPWFCPFTQAEVDGRLVPLPRLHWQRMRTTDGWSFELEAEVITRHADALQPMMTVLLEAASRSDNSRAMFQDLIGHAATLDGRISRCELHRDGQAYWLDDCRYPSTAALVEALMLPFLAVTEPERFFDQLPGLPPRIPVMSNTAARIFVAAFLAPASRPRAFDLHLHWGARDMAGFPPRNKGYFTARSKTRSLRGLCDVLTRSFPSFEPLCVALLPAAVYMLCPTSAHPSDAELLAELFQRVRGVPPEPDAQHPIRMARRVEQVVEAWWAARASSLSTYFRGRFRPRSGVLHPGDLPERSDPVEPDGFGALTLQQACMIVGALTALVAAPGAEAG